jgi:hypothetical protein
MQQLDSVTGFSELKDILIRTYRIERSREFIKLYFSEIENMLLMHDYDDHSKVIYICLNTKKKKAQQHLTSKAKLVVENSLDQLHPSKYLNDQFQLYGFFRF